MFFWSEILKMFAAAAAAGAPSRAVPAKPSGARSEPSGAFASPSRRRAPAAAAAAKIEFDVDLRCKWQFFD